MESDSQLSFYAAWDYAETLEPSAVPEPEGEPNQALEEESVKDKKHSSGKRRRRHRRKHKKEEREKRKFETQENDEDSNLVMTKQLKMEPKEDMVEEGMDDEELQVYFNQFLSSSSETEFDEEAEKFYYNNYCSRPNPASPSPEPLASMTEELEGKLHDKIDVKKENEPDPAAPEVLDLLTSLLSESLAEPTTTAPAAVPIAPSQSLGSKAKAIAPIACTKPSTTSFAEGCAVKAIPLRKEMASSSSSNPAKSAASASPKTPPKAYPLPRGKAGPAYEGYYYETWSF